MALLTKILSGEIQHLIVLIAFLTLLYILKHLKKSFKDLPPGPIGYPIVGIIPLIKKEFHLLLFDYAMKFGKIVSLKMGGETVVVLSDYQTIKKAFSCKYFSARPKTELSQLLGGYGIVNSEGPLWKTQRKYLLNQKLGMKHWKSGAGSLEQIESVVSREVQSFLYTLENDYSNTFVNLTPLFNCAVSNVICSIIMSRRFRYQDPKFQRFMFLFDEGFRLFTMTGAMTFLPFLKVLPGISDTCTKLRQNREEMIAFVREIISEHRQELDPQNPKDLIDSYLVQESTPDQFFEDYDPEQQLEQIILDLFSASVETTRTSLLWAIVFMLHNPKILSKVRDELNSVVGEDNLPQLSDMIKLPYTRATLYEIMRRSSVVPMGTTHATDREVQFEGFVLPQNSHVIPLIHAVHMNPKNWENPEEFRPERFINKEGVLFKPEHFMPFGVGQRKCLGDRLAEQEFFLFFTSLVHVFDLGNNPEQTMPSLRGTAGVTVTPSEFSVHIKLRNKTALDFSNKESSSYCTKLSSDRIYG
ncbi:cytochrome P450 18a1 [Lepeophtheirus salmonis]|uniref:Cytochrome P450 CYP18A1 [Tribolium castaneum] n=2 Tax=Lepeophtheirus salmonis TaxID=72036 RepID=A0A0K2TIE8_LEPSM|nr:cytochrome P450 18a1-like [Lepeophtheirus salmonis]